MKNVMFNCKLTDYEREYLRILNHIIQNGVYEKNERTGIGTFRIPNVTFHLGENDGIPLLTSKKVQWKSAIDEILWIMQKGSNNIHDLGSHIWDQWADENGSIGKAYGYQISKHQQVKKLIDTLKSDPSSRRGVLDLWQIGDIPEMNLTPCCYTSVWNISNGKLNGMLVQRSGDMFLGVVFNTLQYRALQYMLASELNVKVGDFLHTIADAHIYENQFHQVVEQLRRGQLLNDVDRCRRVNSHLSNDVIHGLSFYFKQKDPTFNDEIEIGKNIKIFDFELKFDPKNNDFWSFTSDNFTPVDYDPFPAIKAPVAV
ncbi:MAG TPA: thymidylate synthase [Lachnospiraceae bacterium]|nr:thymidylate synthase [Lachnospiraceae bacterium]